MITLLFRGVYGPAPVIRDTPTDGTIFSSMPYLIWKTAAKNVKQLIPAHFRIQLATDLAFSNILDEGFSILSVTRFQYESSPGVWSALPTSGLAASDVGKRVRYLSPISTSFTYYWRVRVEQQLVDIIVGGNVLRTTSNTFVTSNLAMTGSV